MVARVRRFFSGAAVAGLAFGAFVTAGGVPSAAAAPSRGQSPDAVLPLKSLGTSNLAAAGLGPALVNRGRQILLKDDRLNPQRLAMPASPRGAAAAPGSSVVASAGSGVGFDGLDLLDEESAGGGALEPPDQALCVGNGYVMEGINQAWQVFDNRAVSLTSPVDIIKFFKLPTSNTFVSDPRCVYDPIANRFYALTLEIDQPTPVTFSRAHNVFAISKTGDPTGDWSIFSFDVTDDGQQSTPLHPTCPCLGDQPLMGFDKYGFYLSTNEYSDSEVLPVQLPPAANGAVNRVFTLPDFRNGQAQVYAMSKSRLLQGDMPPVYNWDTANTPLPAGSPTGSVWFSLQPSHQPPGDQTPATPGGAEYFLSTGDLAGDGAEHNQIAVWAIGTTAALDSANAASTLKLQNKVINTLSPNDTYQLPISADQKSGATVIGQGCTPSPCPEEKLNANDDRMNEVMLTNGDLWSGFNTRLPAINPNGTGQDADPRTGIMYFQVHPDISGGTLNATMARDGYVVIPRDNVLFPSIAASPEGPVVMTFSVSGVDYYPSVGWTRLDGVAAGQGPTVHITGAGAGPDDGFTGYCLDVGLGGVGDPTNLCSSGIARWGDYSWSDIDSQGCIWGAAEYVPNTATNPRDNGTGDWGTYIQRVATPSCSNPLSFMRSRLHINACGPLFTNPAGADDFGVPGAGDPAGLFKGQNPQLNIIAGNMKITPDGKSLAAILTINNLSKSLPPGGEGNEYYMYWAFGQHKWYTNVRVDATGAVSYTDGTFDSLRSQRSSGPADTGSFNPGPKGTVVVNVPLDQIGSPKPGEILTAPNAETREDEAGGTLVFGVDSAAAQYDYQVGEVCAAAAGNTSPAPVVPAISELPSTPPSGFVPALLGLAAIAGAVAMLLLRPRARA